jgi:microcin C transport system substrate-binding protein
MADGRRSCLHRLEERDSTPTLMRIVLREFALAAALLILGLFGLTAPTMAEPVRHYAISRVGAVKFGPDFKNFDFVNPDAPKGGTLRLADIGGFDNLNPFTFKGLPASGLALLHDSLMAASLDEPATAYGLIAEWVSYPDDYSSATFGLNPAARFQDGTPITAEDVVFSFQSQIKADPVRAITYRDVVKVEKTGEREVTFRFARPGNRDLPFIVSQLQIAPRHYWTGKTEAGEPRDITATTLDPPVGSGPYRIKSVDAGRSISYERVRNYWAADMPINRGMWNYDEIRFASYRDDVPAFEAFKAGEIDLMQEGSSKRWATEYTFPAARDGRVKRLEIPQATVAAAQAFIFNLRRTKFADPRVRQALELAFDFESANRTLFNGLYTRLSSYFDNSELAAKGLPTGRELELLEKVRDKVPAEVFTTEYKSPVNATPEQVRSNLREASRLLDQAGWVLQGSERRNRQTGEILSIEFLNYDTAFDRILLPFKQSLEKLGIRFTIRMIDAPQYEQRVKSFDFDMITDIYSQTHAPGNEQREFWGSEAADKPASRNRTGIKNPAVDFLVEQIIYAPTREDVVAATRALDRVLLWNHYAILQWYRPSEWVAYWDKFGRPSKFPSQAPGWRETWWLEANVAKQLGGTLRR